MTDRAVNPKRKTRNKVAGTDNLKQLARRKVGVLSCPRPDEHVKGVCIGQNYQVNPADPGV